MASKAIEKSILFFMCRWRSGRTRQSAKLFLSWVQIPPGIPSFELDGGLESQVAAYAGTYAGFNAKYGLLKLARSRQTDSEVC